MQRKRFPFFASYSRVTERIFCRDRQIKKGAAGPRLPPRKDSGPRRPSLQLTMTIAPATGFEIPSAPCFTSQPSLSLSSRGACMRTTIAVVFALLAAPNVFAAERFRIDPDHTFVHFAVVHTGVSSVRGRFSISKGEAMLDTAQKSASMSVDIDPYSIDTGVKKLNGILAGELFFDTAKFKAARFVG